MSHYKPYPVYKDSGVEWIGKIPTHWETLRVKRGVLLRNERRSDSPEGWTYVGLEDVEPESGRYAPTPGASRQSEVSMVGVFRAGDILYGKLRPYLRKSIVAEEDGICSTEFLVLSAQRATASWAHRWLLTPEVTQQIEAGCEGAKMPRADWEHVGSIPMPLPPAAEQTAIAAAIDRETSRIDALIGKKTRFIELLQEKRQALITHAVTKGLDPNVKMKDSGVEWIGEVPEHWKVKPICRVASCNDDTLSENVQPDQMLRYVDISSVNHTDGIAEVTEIRFADAPSRARRSAKTGDVVISTVRTYLKAVAAVTESYADCTYSTGFAVLRPRPSEVVPEFLKWLALNDLVIQAIEAHSEGLSYPAINATDLVKLKAVVPPLAEQSAIADAIDRETSRIDALIAKSKRSIDLLKERRSAFITAAVTGQIDLREAA